MPPHEYKPFLSSSYVPGQCECYFYATDGESQAGKLNSSTEWAG